MAIYFVSGGNDLYVLPDADINDPSQTSLVGELGSAVGSSRALALSDGRLHVVDNSDDRVYSFDPTTPGTVTDEGEFPAGLVTPTAIVRIGGFFYVNNETNDELWRYPVTGGPADAVSLGGFPSNVGFGVGFATDGTDLFIQDFQTPNLHRLAAADLATPGNSVSLTGTGVTLVNPRSLFYFNGDLYADNSETPRILVRLELGLGNTYVAVAVSTTDLLPSASFVGATHVPDTTAPATPAAPTFDNETSTGLRINWVAPDDGGDPIVDYDLRYREQGTGPWTDVNDLTGTSRTITGLDSATTYEAQVRATNSVGDSAYSPSGTGTTLADLTPSAPAVADQASTVGANVNFQLPVGTGGDAPLSYGASNLPAGLSFSGSTRRISGSPTTIQTRTVTYTVTDLDGDSDSVTFDFVIGAALALSDMDDTGLQVDFKVLIEVSGTTDLYADSDRGGSDSPIDGELGIGDDETALSRIRWLTSNGRLIFNDNDSPSSVRFGRVFQCRR